jgi:SAM-dependent methyltransferase
MRLEVGNRFPRQVDFVWGDSTRPYVTGESGNDGVNQKNLRSILAGRGPASFDMINCQFAIHYFASSQATLETFLRNAAINLKIGGYLVGTTFDGKAIYDALKEDGSGAISGSKKNIRIWEIKRDYDANAAFDAVGQRILVYFVTIGQEIPEYLINFEHLIKTASKFGFELAGSNEINGLELGGIKAFKDYYPQVIEAFGKKKSVIDDMNEDEKRYSYFNRFFAFKRVGSVTATELPAPVPMSAPVPIPVEPQASSAAAIASEAASVPAPPVETKKITLAKKPLVLKK